MKYICQISKQPHSAAAALKWLATHIERYSLIYRHRTLNAYAWGGLGNSPGGIWHAALVVFDGSRDADRFERFLSRCDASYAGSAGAGPSANERK